MGTKKAKDRTPRKSSDPRGGASALLSTDTKVARETDNALEVQYYGEGIDGAVAERICQLIEETPRGLDHICQTNEGLCSARQFHRWLDKSPGLRQRYLRARERQADYIMDETLEIADDSARDWKTLTRKDGSEIEVPDQEVIARAALRIKARDRMAGKLAPKKWGDRLDLTSGGQPLTRTRVIRPSDGAR